jgi:glycosyltransferase involved in cell wall biosynthesis
LADSNPIRVLHVVHGLDRGGIETWLVQVLRHIDQERFRFDFVTSTAKPCAYDETVQALGAQLFRCPNPIRFWSFGPRFKAVLREHGPYAVVHSHFNPCGYPLMWAHQVGVPVRIAHSHNAAAELGDKPIWVRGLFRPLARHWLKKHATLGLAASREAAASLFGPGWDRSPNRRILYYGIDLAPFAEPVNVEEVRREMGIPLGAVVVGHVGRFHEQKNHALIVEIAREMMRREPNVYFLLVGDGPLRPGVAARIAETGLAARVLLPGVRTDVARLMRGALDCFVLPSLHEGLPLVGLEAQAAGLPCVFSDTITQEVDVLPPLVVRLPLSAAPSIWAEQVLGMLRRRSTLPAPGACLEAVRRSPFDIRNAVKELESVYAEQARTTGR